MPFEQCAVRIKLVKPKRFDQPLSDKNVFRKYDDHNYV